MTEEFWPSDKDQAFKIPGAGKEDMPEGIPLTELTEDELMENLPPEEAESAIYALERFLEAHPTSIRARSKLGSLLADGWGDGIAGAERVFKEVLAFDRDNIVTMVRLALLQGHPHSGLTAEESLELLERASTLSGDPYILRNYANKAWETDQLNRAVAAFNQLKEMATGPSAVFFRRVAEESLEAIRRGERPLTFVYWYPEIS